MAKREYSFYPGCSSQKGASSSNYLVSVQTMCEELDIQLNEIPDWNCCSASIGYAAGGELPRLALSARNIALSEEHNPGQEIVATCAACWLSTRETQERLEADQGLLAEANEALAEAGLKLKNDTPIKHMAEVLVEDIGYDEIGAKVKKPLEGIKIAGRGTSVARPIGHLAYRASPTKTPSISTSWSRRWALTPCPTTKRRCSAAAAPWRSPSQRSPRR